ncbi:group II intron reverse transcriptase/maturase [Microbulbifer spongiae]|uniref:Group II intron reverse transcriptase/maturase n=1 Tax=Microbulbifer spongiae TaxID=2944933 RepID=A0ABY9EG25_9GAMM|nr:group II intron reverse transcriptase/maturase [Microbulbifer sp. MI-G]WKD50519.1 group II intron reverse transcriptase/maturase [Microbulbifer sp. MI-G]
MTTALHAIAFKAQSHPRHRFQNLYGLLNSKLLHQSWVQLNKQARPGIDGVTTEAYRQSLSQNIHRLHQRLRGKHYRTQAIKRILIPKGNGKQRPLGLPTVEDKLVQQSVAQILQSIWEQDLQPFSYGYRSGKSAHQAVHSLGLNLQFKGYGYVVEADIKGFFDQLDHRWLLRMLALRIDDKALLTLIKQWLKIQVQTPDGKFNKPEAGTPQGGVISQVLANIYLHYALDLGFEKMVKPRMHGRAMLIRYADDFVVTFQLKTDAERFYRVLPQRLNKFGLQLAPEKTHLKRFSRFHPRRKRQFQFLGFEFYWSLDVNQRPRLRRRTAAKKQKDTMETLYHWIKAKRSERLREWLPVLKRKLQGFQNYFGLPDNSRSLCRLYSYVLHSIHKWPNRRSQRKSYN